MKYPTAAVHSFIILALILTTSASYTSEESSENSKSLYNAINSVLGASETNREHRKHTYDNPPVLGTNPYPAAGGEDYPKGPTAPGVGESYGSGPAGNPADTSCPESGCPLPNKQRNDNENPAVTGAGVFDVRNSAPSNTNTKNTPHSQSGYPANNMPPPMYPGYPQVNYGYPPPNSYQPNFAPGYYGNLPMGPSGSYGNPSMPPGGNYGNPSMPPSGNYRNPSLSPGGNYGNPSMPPGGNYGNPPSPGSYNNYPSPPYNSASPYPSGPYNAPYAHHNHSPHGSYGYSQPGAASAPSSHVHGPNCGHSSHPGHGHSSLDHSLKTKSEYTEVGHHQGPFQGYHPYGYGSGYGGGYNGAFNRPGF